MSIDSLYKTPGQFDFYQAVFMLQNRAGSRGQKVGADALPNQELVRFKSVQHLGFPGSPVAKVKPVACEQGGQYHQVDVTFMGLTGPSGALPQHYSELVLSRIKQKDTTMVDFYDMFNHRLVSLYYRAWEKYRQAINYSTHSEHFDPFTRVLGHLSGGNAPYRLHMAGFFSRRVRSAVQLERLLTHYLELDVDVKQFVGTWRPLASSEQTRLGTRENPEGQFARLGSEAAAGKSVWDVNSAIDITFHCKDKAKARALLPQGPLNGLLKDMLHSYLGYAVKANINVKTQLKNLPVMRLGQQSSALGHGGVTLARERVLSRDVCIQLRGQ